MMLEGNCALLPDRGVIAVGGTDAQNFLQNLLTNDISHLHDGTAAFAGLLSPQGKILFDFLVTRQAGAYWLDVARDKAAELSKRLTLYKLRAAVTLTDASETYAVQAHWNTSAPIGAVDPRQALLGGRAIVAHDDAAAATDTPDAYHGNRIALGIPEGGKDYDYGDTYPHEALYDRLGGVSFSKGCYVGQEIVSRMEHRATVKKRIVPVSSTTELPATRPDILLGEVPIGKLGSVSGRQGLALIRTDRAMEAAGKGIALTAAGQAISVHIPAWAQPNAPAADAAGAP